MINKNDNFTFNFYDYLINNNYFFSKNSIENYLLSLKVKPFVILTGNSGTGKTKLSQLFAEYLQYSSFHMVDVTTKSRSWGYNEKNKTEDNECGWSLSTNDFRNIFPLNEIENSYEIEIGGHKTTANISFLVQLYYKNEYEGFKQHFKKLYYDELEQKRIDEKRGVKHITQKVKVGILCDSIKSLFVDDFKESEDISLNMNVSNFNTVPLPKEIFNYLPFKNSIACEIMCNDLIAEATLILKLRISNYRTKEINEYFESLKKENIKNYELKIFGFKPDIKNFKPEWDSVEFTKNVVGDDNYVIVPVGANWTENRNIVGYYNVLTKSYQHTSSLDLLLNAKDKKKPYFLILDEMNLSHVERYFSDFLSAMESDEPIPLYKNNGENKEKIVPEEIKIPKNVFIIGTVNVDETTYMFSPKVLDRANVLEFKTFEEISIVDYIKNDVSEIEFTGDVEYLENPLSDTNLIDNILFEVNKDFNNVLYDENYIKTDKEGQIREYKKNIINNNLLEKLSTELTQINIILKNSGFEFGYRTVNEILAFMLVAWKYEGKQKVWNNWGRYFDAQILQKILPKLHGSQMVLDETLNNLLSYCLGLDTLDNIPEILEIKENYPYPESAKKLMEMRNVLDKQMYVSFIN